MRGYVVISLQMLVVFCLSHYIGVCSSEEMEKRTAPMLFLAPAAHMRQQELIMNDDYPVAEPSSRKVGMMFFPRTGRGGLKAWVDQNSGTPYYGVYTSKINGEY